MGFVARKSFKVMPGVRMTVSKSGISASAGIPGARISKNTSGRTTRTVGVPGTGIYHTKSSSSGRSSSRAQKSAKAPAAPATRAPKPGFTAPKWEKELYKAVSSSRFEELPRIAQTYPDAAPVAATLEGLVAMQEGHNDRALEVCRWAWANSGDIGDHPFVRRYLGSSEVTLTVAEGVSATMPISRDALGLALAELEQAAGNQGAAVAVVEQLDPSTIAAVSLCELYGAQGRHDEVVDVTNGLRNEDDPTALLVAYRGVALRELGHLTAAREAFKEALKSKSRDAEIRHYALLERARTYLAENKRAMAKKDVERVIAENADYPGVRELLASIQD
jgi:tetratricopeptide (TPR) repeat protein